MRSAAAGLASLVLATAGIAAAQPAATAPEATPPATPAPLPATPAPAPPVPSSLDETAPAQSVREPVSETAALWIGLGGTLGAWGTVAAGAVLSQQHSSWAGPALVVGIGGTLLAPSAGLWYAHAGLSRGLALRVAGVGLEAAALFVATRCDDECSSSGSALIEGLAIGGLGVYAAGTIDDIVAAPGEARRYNERIRSLALVPVIRRDVTGVALAARF
jgi:hypothetical protein